MSSKNKMATNLVCSGEIEDNKSFNSVITPIYRSTTYKLNEDVYSLIKKYCKTENPNSEVSDEELRDLRYSAFYTRDSNPNVGVVQRKMAEIEGCDDCVATSSGMGAITSTILSLIKGKKYIVSTPDLYGASYTFIFNELREMFGVKVIELEDFLSGEWRCRPLQKNSRLSHLKDRKIDSSEIAAIYVETMSNPFLVMPPLGEIKETRDELCPETPIVVDNTFLSPANFKPFSILDSERDLVLHSATKYLGGHSDVMAGLVCGALAKINKIWEKVTLYGCCLDAETAYYLERGMKTLHVRMERHNQNSYEVFKYLTKTSGKYQIQIFHPLSDDQSPDFAKPLVEQKRLGGMITFNIGGGKNEKDGIRFMNALHETHVIKHATSLGGVESLISMPYNTSQPTWKQQEMLGMKNYGCLLRLSLGIEDVEDIIASLDRAFREIGV